MSAPLPVREYASAAEMRAEAARLHKSCFAPRKAAPVRAKPVREAASPSEDVNAPAKSGPCLRQPAVEPVTIQTLAQLTGLAAISGRDAVRIVSEIAGFTGVELSGGCRGASLAKARHIGFWLAVKHAGCSLPRTGQLFGDRDHTTALHGLRRVEAVIRALGLIVPGEARAAAEVLWSADWPSNADLGLGKPRRR